MTSGSIRHMLALLGFLLIAVVVVLFLVAHIGIIGLVVGVIVGLVLIAFDRGAFGNRGL